MTTKNFLPYTLLLILVFLLTTPLIVLADAEQYLYAGVSRDSSYQQDGNGVWAGRAGITYTRTQTGSSYFPLVGDVDNDTRNEIVRIEGTDLLILNYTSGVGIVAETSVPYGVCNMSTTHYLVTPALFDYDNDGDLDIVTWNCSHMLVYSWNGTSMVEVQNTTTNFNLASTAVPTFQNPVIKCAAGSQWASGKRTCAFASSNRTGTQVFSVFTFYNVQDNTVTHTASAAAMANADASFRNTHLYDGNNDGYLEAYYSRYDSANGDLFIYSASISAAEVPTNTLLKQHDLAVGRPFTDIIVTKLDGVTPSISWGYSSDGTNFDAFTINAATAATIESSYCTLLTCPEGNQLSVNMFLDDGTFGTYSGDVCYYIRNYANNDPGVNIDTVLCLSLYAGKGTKETTITNTNINFTNNPIIHLANMAGTKGLLTSRFITQAGTKETLLNLIDQQTCIPVDFQKSGSLDIVCMNTTLLQYYDDNYINYNWEISSMTYTPNPLCQSYTYTYKISVNDSENDAGNCYASEVYVNGTVIANFSLQNFTVTPSNVDFFYYADTTGNFLLQFYCKDQYHTTYNYKQFSVLITNDSSCNLPGTTITDTYLTNATQEAEATFEAATESFWDGLGLGSKSARNAVIILIALIVAVGIFMYTQSGIISMASIPCVLLIGMFIGLTSIVPIVVMILFLVAWIVWMIVGRSPAGG